MAIPVWMRPKASGAGFDPRSIAGLNAWFDASDASTITLNSGNVSEWRDKSGNSRHVSQATAAQQPLYRTGRRNGFATVGANNSLAFLAVAYSQAQPVTAFAAYKLAAISAPQFILAGSSAANVQNIIVGRSVAGETAGLNMATGYFPVAATTSWDVLCTVANSTSSVVMRNQLADNTGAAGANAMQGITVLSDFQRNVAFNGEVGEILLYGRALSRSERLAVAAYLMARWSV